LASADVFPAVHALALRGSLRDVPGGHAELEAAGLVRLTSEGFTLTQAGYSRHRALLEEERATIDVSLLGVAYERFSSVARQVKAIAARRKPASEAARRRYATELSEAADALDSVLQRTIALAPRFGPYIDRLSNARQAGLGDCETADRDSIFAIIRDLEEDYLQTLGRGYDHPDI
jgi:hypothetical protein